MFRQHVHLGPAFEHEGVTSHEVKINGKTVADLALSFRDEGGKKHAVVEWLGKRGTMKDAMATGPNAFGPEFARSVLRAIRDEHKITGSITGKRISGWREKRRGEAVNEYGEPLPLPPAVDAPFEKRAAKLARADAPQFHLSDPIEADFLGEVAHIRHVHDHTGAKVASLKLVPRGDTLHVAWFGRPAAAPGVDANALGPAHVREIGRVVKAAYPETKRVTGERISGFRSRAGLSDVHTSVKLARKNPNIAKNRPRALHDLLLRLIDHRGERDAVLHGAAADAFEEAAPHLVRPDAPHPIAHMLRHGAKVGAFSDFAHNGWGYNLANFSQYLGDGPGEPYEPVLAGAGSPARAFRAATKWPGWHPTGLTPVPLYRRVPERDGRSFRDQLVPGAFYSADVPRKSKPNPGATALSGPPATHERLSLALPFTSANELHDFIDTLPPAVQPHWRAWAAHPQHQWHDTRGSETPVKLSRVGRWLGGLISSFRDELHESLGRHGMTPSEAAAHRARIVSKVRAEEAAKDAKLRAKHEAGAKWLAETNARVKAFADKHHERFARTFNIADKVEAHKKLSGLLNHAIDTGLRGRGKFTGRTQPSGLDAGGEKAEFRVNIRQAPVKNFAGGTDTHVPNLVKKPVVKLARIRREAFEPLRKAVLADHTQRTPRLMVADELHEAGEPGAHVVAAGELIAERDMAANRYFRDRHNYTGTLGVSNVVSLNPEIDHHEEYRVRGYTGFRTGTATEPQDTDRMVRRGFWGWSDEGHVSHRGLDPEVPGSGADPRSLRSFTEHQEYAPLAQVTIPHTPGFGLHLGTYHVGEGAARLPSIAHVTTPEQFEHLISDFPKTAQEYLRDFVARHVAQHGAPWVAPPKAKKPRKKKLARQRFAGEGASVAMAGSANHEARLKVANQILRESGLTPAEVRAAILHAGGATRPALTALVKRNAHPDHVKYTAAWLGLATQQPAVAVATVDPNGRDTLHVISGAGDHAGITSALKRAGVEKFTVEQKPTGHRIFVINPDGKYPVAQIAKANNARHSAARVSVTRLGSGASADAAGGTAADAKSRAAYREAIDAFERAGASEA